MGKPKKHFSFFSASSIARFFRLVLTVRSLFGEIFKLAANAPDMVRFYGQSVSRKARNQPDQTDPAPLLNMRSTTADQAVTVSLLFAVAAHFQNPAQK